MNTVHEHKVLAHVRPEGALGIFEFRPFYLMLGNGTADQLSKEAIRILRQIGWETRGVQVDVRT
jgi:hypothetical protein